MQGKAAFLEARTAFSQGNREQASRLFEEAAKSLTENAAKTALLNSAILRLADPSSTTTVQQTGRPLSSAITADLELERALSIAVPLARRTSIEEFLTQHPDHPRVPEARLAAAEAALAGPNPDFSFARAQLETLAADPEKSATLSPSRIACVRLRIEDLSKDSTAAIATARSILEQVCG